MAAPHNVEFEAAKFLQKLIHESTDEPAKLATKLYVILQHMKASGKENSMPYQVISRAMETVINQHGLDIDALMSSRVPTSSGFHAEESSRAQAAGCSQSVGAVVDSKSGMIENDTNRTDGFASSRPPAVPSSMGQDPFQGSIFQRSNRSCDHESPSSMDTRSTNSHSQDRRETVGWEQQGGQKDSKRANIKRKRSDSSAMEPHIDSTQQPDAHIGMPDMRKDRLTGKVEIPGNFSGSPSTDPSAGKGIVDSELWKQGFLKGAAPGFRERGVPGQLVPSNQGDVVMANLNSARLDAAGISLVPLNADRLLQGGNPYNLGEMGRLRSAASRDTGKSPACFTSMPFKEHHLKQLRAQCLVFLAFRNGLPPKRLHLEIALGNSLPKEGPSGSVDGAQNELIADKGKQQTTLDSSTIGEVAYPQGNLANLANSERVFGSSVAAGRFSEADLISKETDSANITGEKPGPPTERSCADEEKKHFPSGRGILETQTQSQETTNSSAILTASLQPDISGMRNSTVRVHEDNLLAAGVNHSAFAMGVNKHLKPEMIRWTGAAHNDSSRGGIPAHIQHDLGNRKDTSVFLSQHDSAIQIHQQADIHSSASWKASQDLESEYYRAVPGSNAHPLLRNSPHDDNSASEIQARSISDASKVVPASETKYMHNSSSPLAHIDKFSELEEEDQFLPAGLSTSPKYTLSEKWIMAHQKRKLVTEQKWVQKLHKADQRIAACFNELKETVSSSEDISAKTRSVIELKKLQLLELQRRLRRNVLNDFFKPVQTEMDRLKSIKKHRIGRRLKHVEKYEQKMKEERQKRIRERQKEFFSEIEVHKERLEDIFKFKRERCKGFNRYVKEFHKRKERIHREKIDRIQREKINLLKINDVEGYLRMVQDAKSDRVKQLLKETEKYLLKLGSKLKEAKSTARQAELDENGTSVDESSEIAFEMEDGNDQAKHYKESNEKYYLIAHSVKENITDQPTGLLGGKLREYQMNGLRWLVSLYNNHLNGILADEMGLGKTVQVISLMCYLMETKNDRGPFLVVVPSSVLPGWEHELNFWAPGINKIVYAGPPEERRRLFKESIVHQKFNVLLTTYEYLMNKHDRPKLSKIHWHYVIIDEGHRIKNASCKLNADLKHYHSSHRLLLTGTPLQNNLEELWALLNFLLPNIFNSSEDFSQWFNKPFESGDNSPDETLLSEEENLLIINRLHQVLRPFVLRRLKHKVENQLPEKIERLVRCEASAYQKLLMKRVEENLGALASSKSRAVHNSVIELRNICNHPYLSQLHTDQVDNLIPKHFLPPIIRLCGKLEMLDRLLPKLKATNHRILFFSTMTRLLDVMEEYLVWKQYRYLRLDGHTSGQDRGALIQQFNKPDSPFFIFLLSIRAGGVGVNLQAADTVIIFDTDWNPQVDLQAQARAHRIGQKKDVLVLRLETVHTVEEQVRAAAEHKLGVANQSITAGFFDNNTSAEDRREYLESLLRESKKEEAAPVLDDDGLNDILARSESEIDVFEAVDQQRREEEMAIWKRLVAERGGDGSEVMPPLPSRLVTDGDLSALYEAIKIYEASQAEDDSSSGVKRKGGYLGGCDTQHYGRGKRAREVRSYEEQWTEDEFEKMCQADSPETSKPKEEQMDALLPSNNIQTACKLELSSQNPQALPPSLESASPVKKEVTPPVKRGRGRPRRTPITSASAQIPLTPTGVTKPEIQKGPTPTSIDPIGSDSHGTSAVTKDASGIKHHVDVAISPSSQKVSPLPPSVDAQSQSTPGCSSVPTHSKRQGRKGQPREKNIPGQPGAETVRRRGRKPSQVMCSVPSGSAVQDPKPNHALQQPSSNTTASVTTAPSMISNASLAESLAASFPKSSDGSGSLSVEVSKASELPVKQASSDGISGAVAPQRDKEKQSSVFLPHCENAPVLESAVITAGIDVQDPKPNEQSAKQVSIDASSVAVTPSASSDIGKGEICSQGQGASISESSAGSVAALVVGSIRPSEVENECHTITPQSAISGSESSLPSSVGPRPGKRQSQKPQSGIEPVRRRGRKRGQTVSSVPDPPIVQDLSRSEALKSPGSIVLPTVATSSVAANQEMVSHVLPVPMIPAVPVCSTALAGISGSMHHINVGFAPSIPAPSLPSPSPSGALDIPSGTPQTPALVQGQGHGQKGKIGERVPRQRGRKKSTVLPAGPNNLGRQDSLSRRLDGRTDRFVERKVIATRSRQINVSQPNNGQEEAHRGGSSVATVSSDLLAGQPKDLPLIHSSPVEGSASVTADETNKSRELRLASLTEEIKSNRSPVDLPPISSSGRTNVIVLALESTYPTVDPTGNSFRSMKEECSELQNAKSSSLGVISKPEASGVQVSCAAGTTQLEEEMTVPPGFDTARTCVSAGGIKRPLESDDSGTSKIPDAKTSPVVLALESTAPNVDPCIPACQNMSEKEESYEVHVVNESALGSGFPLNSEGYKADINKPDIVSAADAMTTGQAEEEMSAPPGFDIPQLAVSETAVVKSLESDDGHMKADESASMAGIGPESNLTDANKVSHKSSESLVSNITSTSSSCMGISQPLQSECKVVHDVLPIVGLDSGDSIAESSDLVEEDSTPPGFGTSQTCLLQDKICKPCDSGDNQIPVDINQSKKLSESEVQCLSGEPDDNMQAMRTSMITPDVALDESKNKLAAVGDGVIQKEEVSVPDKDLALDPKDSGEDQLCDGAAVSKFKNESADKTLPEKPSALALDLMIKDDENVIDEKFPKQNAETAGTSEKDDSACDMEIDSRITMADPTNVAIVSTSEACDEGNGQDLHSGGNEEHRHIISAASVESCMVSSEGHKGEASFGKQNEDEGSQNDSLVGDSDLQTVPPSLSKVEEMGEESSDIVEEDSTPPELGTSQPCLLQDDICKPCESGDSQIPTDIILSKNLKSSDIVEEDSTPPECGTSQPCLLEDKICKPCESGDNQIPVDIIISKNLKSRDIVEEDSTAPESGTSQACLLQDKISKPCESGDSQIPVDIILSKDLKSSDIVEEDSTTTEFGTSQTCLLQDKICKPCVSGDNQIPVHIDQSKNLSESEVQCLQGAPDGSIQAMKTSVIAADVALDESRNKLATVDDGVIQREEVSIPDRDLVLDPKDSGVDQLCDGAAVSKLGRQCETDIAAVEKGSTIPTPFSSATDSEDGRNLKEPSSRSPMNPTSENKMVENAQIKKPPFASGSETVDDGNIKLPAISLMSIEDGKCSNENVEIGDTSPKDGGACETETDSEDGRNLKEPTSRSSMNPTSENEMVENAQLKKPPFGSGSVTVDDGNIKLPAISLMSIEDGECSNENVEIGDTSPKDGGACETETDSEDGRNLKEPTSSSPMNPTSENKMVENAQIKKPPFASGSETIDDQNVKLPATSLMNIEDGKCSNENVEIGDTSLKDGDACETETDSEDGKNLKEPTSRNPMNATSENEMVENAQIKKPPFVSGSETVDDGNIKLPVISLMSIEDGKCSNENVEIGDTSPKDGSACETETESHIVVADPIQKTDAATTITEGPTSPVSLRNEIAETVDDGNIKLPAISLMSIEDGKCSNENVKLGDTSPKDGGACETETESHIVVADPIQKTDAATTITEGPTSPVSLRNEIAETVDDGNIKLPAISLMSIEDGKCSNENVKIGDTSPKDGGACETETESHIVVADPIKKLDATTTITEGPTSPFSLRNEIADKPQPEKPPALALDLMIKDDENVKPSSIVTSGDEKFPKQNAETAGASEKDDGACDVEIDSRVIMVDPKQNAETAVPSEKDDGACDMEIDSRVIMADPINDAIVSTSEACDEGNTQDLHSGGNEEERRPILSEASVEPSMVSSEGWKGESSDAKLNDDEGSKKDSLVGDSDLQAVPASPSKVGEMAEESR